MENISKKEEIPILIKIIAILGFIGIAFWGVLDSSVISLLLAKGVSLNIRI